jgi:hypothetical protein
MAQELVKALMVEIDGNPERLKKALRESGLELQMFAGKSTAAGKAAAGAADVTAQKQANAARAISSATETIARQGKVTGETAKQLVSQGANLAFAFGPTGAFVGAIGIATVAIVGMFSKTKEELDALEKRTVAFQNRIAEMDAGALRREIVQHGRGDRSVVSLDTLFGDDELERSGRIELLKRRGRARLEREEADARAELERLRARPVRAWSEGGAGDLTALEEAKRRVEDLTAAWNEYKSEGKDLQVQMKETGTEENRLAAIEAEVAKGKKDATVATREQTEAERERAQAVKDLVRDQEALAKSTADLVLQHTGTVAQRTAAPFDQLIGEISRAGLPGDEVAVRTAEMEALKKAAVDAAVDIAAVGDALQLLELASALGVKPTVDDFMAFGAIAGEIEAQLRDMDPGTERFAKLLELLKKVNDALAEMGKGIADAGDGKGGGGKKPFELTAFHLQQAADGALQLAENLGLVDANATKSLRSLVQIGTNIPEFLKAVQAGGAGGIIATALPILGALSSLFGGDPEHAQRIRENTKAIRELTAKAGLLGAGLGITGTQAGAARGGVGAVLDEYERRLERARSRGGPGGTDVTMQEMMGFSTRNIARDLGISWSELETTAAALGIELDGSAKSFQQLQAALDDVIGKLGEYGTDLASQQAQAELEIAARNITDPIEQFIIRSGAVAGRSPKLDSITAGLDLSTAEGRAQARANVQAVVEIMKAGGGILSDDDLGGLSGDAFERAIFDLLEFLNSMEGSATAPGSTSGSASGLRGLTEASGSMIVDHTRALVGYARETRDIGLDQLVELRRIALLPMPVPPMLTAFGGVSAGGDVTFGPINVEVAIHLEVDAAASVDERLTVLRDGLSGAVEEGLFTAFEKARKRAGDLRLFR